MNVLSLFDGMSCGRIALDRAGIKYDKYFASEIDKFAIKVAIHNYPDTVQIGDVTRVKGEDLPEIGLLIGGSPCQGFSFAGKGLNFDDPRSRLFFEFVRILNEVRTTNPDVLFLLENVPMKREHQMVISKYLGVEPIIINSALVSAQNRIRYYWTNIKAEPFNLFGDMRSTIGKPKDRRIFLRDILESDVPDKYTLSEKAIAKILRRNWSLPKVEPDKTGTMSTKNNSGQLSVDAGTTLIRTGRGYFAGGERETNKMPTVSANRFEQNNFLKLDVNGTPKNDQSKASCFTAGANSAGNHSDMDIIQSGGKYRRLTPVEVERLQTVPDNYTVVVSDSQRYKMLGNGWTVDVIAWILSHIDGF